MGSALLPIQKAILATLKADAPLVALVATDEKHAGIYDYVPDEAPFPYVQLGELTENRWDTFQRDGKEATITIQVFSRYKGNLEALSIASRVEDVLTKQEIPVDGFQTVAITLDNISTLGPVDGVTRQAIARFRVLVQAEDV